MEDLQWAFSSKGVAGRATCRAHAGRTLRAPATRFRNWVTEDGGAGPAGAGGFPAARGRYHLYVALACLGRIAR